MASLVLNLYEAKTQLSWLVDEAARGKEIIIAKAGKPMARLVPLERKRPQRKPGAWAGRVWLSEDFDAPLDEELLATFEESVLYPLPAPRRRR